MKISSSFCKQIGVENIGEFSFFCHFICPVEIFIRAKLPSNEQEIKQSSFTRVGDEKIPFLPSFVDQILVPA